MTVHLNYTWDKNTYLRASYAKLKHSKAGAIIQIIGLIFLFWSLAILWIGIQKGFDKVDLFPLLVVLYIYVLRWPLLNFQLSRQFQKHADKDAKISWEISEESLKGTSAEKSETVIYWNAIDKVIKTREGYFLSRCPTFIWIPFNSFKNSSDRGQFEILVAGKTKFIKK